MAFSTEIEQVRQSNEVRIARRLLAVIVVLVIFISGGIIAVEGLIGQQQQSIENFIRTLNIAGRQRALSQQVVLHANLFINAQTADERFEAMTALFNAARLMRSEQDILYGQQPLPDVLIWLYDTQPVNLRQQVITYTEAAVQLSQAGLSSELGRQHPDYRTIADGASQLLTDLETTASAYENLLRDSVRQVREMERGRSVLVLIGLVMLGVVALWPGSYFIKRYIYRLYHIITALSRRADMLEERHQFSEAFINSLPVPFLVYEVQTRRIVYISPQYRILMGYNDGDEEIGELYDLDSTIHPDDRTRAKDCMVKATETETLAVGIYRMRQKNGTYVEVESSTLVLSHSGKPLNPPQLVSMLRPTPSAQPASPDETTTALLDSLNPVTRDTLFIYDIADQKLLYVSPSIERLLGYTSDELINMDWETAYEKFVHPEELMTTASRAAHYLRMSKGETREELIRVTHRDGRWVQVYFRFGIYQHTPDGNRMVITGLCSDLRIKSVWSD